MEIHFRFLAENCPKAMSADSSYKDCFLVLSIRETVREGVREGWMEVGGGRETVTQFMYTYSRVLYWV